MYNNYYNNSIQLKIIKVNGEYPLPQKENVMDTYIQYTVKGLNANIKDNKIQLSFMKTSEPIPFFKIRDEISIKFKSLKTNEEIISFINSYGNIFKERNGSIDLQTLKDEVKILRNILRMITILKNVDDANDLIEKVKKLNLDFLDKKMQDYMQQLGKLEEYNNYYFWKNDKYKAGNAIKELKYAINNKYTIEKDNNEDYIFIGLHGIPLQDLKTDVYYILNTLFIRILSNVTLRLDYIDIKHNFRNSQQVHTLLEAIYLYVYNSLGTDNSIRSCNNPNCDNVLIGEHEKKKYCCDKCRNRYNKKINSYNPIEVCINKYRQRAYNAYCKNIVDQYTHKKIYQDLLNKRNKLLKDKVREINIYEKEFTKILEKYI